jgi:hypothetical protein
MGQDVFMQTLEADGNKHFDHGLVIEILTRDAIDPSSVTSSAIPMKAGEVKFSGSTGR